MEEYRLRSRQYARTPEGRQKQTKQKRKYLPVVRHLDTVIKEVMTEDSLLSLQQISDRIYKTKQVKLDPRTIESHMERYLSLIGEAPLEKIDENAYQLNISYYQHHQRKRSQDKSLQ